MEWTEDLLAIRDELGQDEMARRAESLSVHYKYNILVSASHYGTDIAFTPAQAIAFAKLAEAMGKDVLVIGNEIVRLKLYEEREMQVARNEISTREYNRKKEEAK